MLGPVLNKYNNRIHGTTGLSPNEARKDDNTMQVYINTRQRAQFKRKYPPLHTGDSVRTAVKAGSFKKMSYLIMV